MKKGFSVSTAVVLFLIGGILMGIVAGVMIWDWGESIWYGSCWGSAKSELKSLKSDINSAIRNPQSPPIEDYKLGLGSCMYGVVFINGRDNPDLYKKIISVECSQYSGYKSYIIASPICPGVEAEIEEESGGIVNTVKRKFKDWFDMLPSWDKLKAWLNDKMGRTPTPICMEFEHEFSPSGDDSIPPGFTNPDKPECNIGANTYCLDIAPVPVGENDFNYKIDVHICPAENEDIYGGGSSGGAGAGGGF